MKNAINNQFKMKMGSKQKDTEGNFSEKDTSLMKKAPLLNISTVLADDPGSGGDKFAAMGEAFESGYNPKKKDEETEDEPQGGAKVDYATKFGDMASQAGKDSEDIDLIGSISGLMS
jgi:hypothetical protein